jgi:hypothetical protein
MVRGEREVRAKLDLMFSALRRTTDDADAQVLRSAVQTIEWVLGERDEYQACSEKVPGEEG